MPGQNLLPNTNWQLISKLIAKRSKTSAMKEDGTEFQAQVDIQSFDVRNRQPTFYCNNTRELYNGAIIVFGDGLQGLSGYGLRVLGLVPNVSFKCQLPFERVSPDVSVPLTAFAAGISQTGGSAFAPDGGWGKTPSLVLWIDDFANNQCPGARRVLGLRKGVSNNENFEWTCPQEHIARLRGRAVTFGMFTRVKRSQSAASPRLFISDGVSPQSFSNSADGQRFNDAANLNFQLLTVTCTISPSAQSLNLGLEFHGVRDDICYCAIPTLKYGTTMSVHDLGQDINEQLRADTHWNPPFSVPFTGASPATELVPKSGLFGWINLDIEALSLCQCHGSVSKVNCKIELTTQLPGLTFFVAALDVERVQLVFGPQATTQVAHRMVVGGPTMLPLRRGETWAGSPPGCFSMFCDKPGALLDNVTFDFDDVICG